MDMAVDDDNGGAALTAVEVWQLQHCCSCYVTLPSNVPHSSRTPTKCQLQSTAAQVNCESMPDGPANPHGVGFCATETLLKTEQQAQRNINAAKSRIWKVKNPSSLNPMNGSQLSLLSAVSHLLCRCTHICSTLAAYLMCIDMSEHRFNMSELVWHVFRRCALQGSRWPGS